MIHELKIKPEYFAAVVSGDKTFEIRNNADRNFQVGDTLSLKAWDGEFTGQTVERTVSYITDFEQKQGYVVLGLASKREQELAEQLADATRQCGVMAELLREAIGEVPQTQSFPSRCDAALAGKMPDRQDTEWTDATTSPVAADYREMQEQRDQLQSRLKLALDLLHELREGAEIHLHNCKICKNEEGVNNWTGKLQRIDALLAGHVPEPVYYMRDNHTFKRLSDDVDTAITEIEAELDAGWTSGMLCSKRKGFSSLHANYRRPREEFIADCRDALLAAAPKPEGGEPCAIEPPSSSPD